MLRTIPPSDVPADAGRALTMLPVLRILDANANRAAEGLRVVEEYVRFVLEDRLLTQQVKQLRHDLTTALARLPRDERLASRSTATDVGTRVETASEYVRGDAFAVAASNSARTAQALRALEEYGKVDRSELAGAIEALRYRWYDLEAVILRAQATRQRLAQQQLYVLVDGGVDDADFANRCQAVLAGGCRLIQLRDKRLDDRQLLARARQLRQWTANAGALLIVNDRPDLARLADADGVHVGQEELEVRDARLIVGPRALVGVSTHSPQQARQAVLAGADYLGCGPTFASTTKSFAQLPGLRLLEAVAECSTIPAYAIGGIGPDNVQQVLATGFQRIAVGAAVWQAADPAVAARQLLRSLHAAQVAQAGDDSDTSNGG